MDPKSLLVTKNAYILLGVVGAQCVYGAYYLVVVAARPSLFYSGIHQERVREMAILHRKFYPCFLGFNGYLQTLIQRFRPTGFKADTSITLHTKYEGRIHIDIFFSKGDKRGTDLMEKFINEMKRINYEVSLRSTGSGILDGKQAMDDSEDGCIGIIITPEAVEALGLETKSMIRGNEIDRKGRECSKDPMHKGEDVILRNSLYEGKDVITGSSMHEDKGVTLRDAVKQMIGHKQDRVENEASTNTPPIGESKYTAWERLKEKICRRNAVYTLENKNWYKMRAMTRGRPITVNREVIRSINGSRLLRFVKHGVWASFTGGSTREYKNDLANKLTGEYKDKSKDKLTGEYKGDRAPEPIVCRLGKQSFAGGTKLNGRIGGLAVAGCEGHGITSGVLSEAAETQRGRSIIQPSVSNQSNKIESKQSERLGVACKQQRAEKSAVESNKSSLESSNSLAKNNKSPVNQAKRHESFRGQGMLSKQSPGRLRAKNELSEQSVRQSKKSPVDGKALLIRNEASPVNIKAAVTHNKALHMQDKKLSERSSKQSKKLLTPSKRSPGPMTEKLPPSKRSPVSQKHTEKSENKYKNGSSPAIDFGKLVDPKDAKKLSDSGTRDSEISTRKRLSHANGKSETNRRREINGKKGMNEINEKNKMNAKDDINGKDKKDAKNERDDINGKNRKYNTDRKNDINAKNETNGFTKRESPEKDNREIFTAGKLYYKRKASLGELPISPEKVGCITEAAYMRLAVGSSHSALGKKKVASGGCSESLSRNKEISSQKAQSDDAYNRDDKLKTGHIQGISRRNIQRTSNERFIQAKPSDKQSVHIEKVNDNQSISGQSPQVDSSQVGPLQVSSSQVNSSSLNLKPSDLSTQKNALLVHGFNGSGNCTYIRWLAHHLLGQGYRVFCFNARGIKALLLNPIFFHIGWTSDVSETVDYILSTFPGTLDIVGFSMGASWVTKYFGERVVDPRVTRGVAICVPFDFYKLASRFRSTLTNRLIIANYKKYLSRHSHVFASKGLDVGALRHQTMLEMDMEVTQRIFGLDPEQYRRASCVNYIAGIRAPFMIINSMDDPLVPEIEKQVCMNNRNVLLVVTKYGGHLGFIGNDFERTFIESAILEFFRVF